MKLWYLCVLWNVVMILKSSGIDAGIFRENKAKTVIADAMTPYVNSHGNCDKK